MNKRFTIIGAGIAGLTTAIALKQKGFEVIIFESASEIKAVGAGLALAANAMAAYKQLGLWDEIVAKGVLISTAIIYDHKGNVITNSGNLNRNEALDIGNYAIHRADLHDILLKNINPEILILNKKTVSFERNGNTVLLNFEDGTQHETEQLIVAEGIHSPIRKQLLPNSLPRYAGYTCWRAVIDNPNLDIENSTETWGKGKRFGYVRVADNRIYWFACVNASAHNEKYKKYTVADLSQEFEGFHEPISTILSNSKSSDLIWGDINDLKPIAHFAFGNIVLLGDAAHATTPNMGQGACQAIEDAIILADELSKNQNTEGAFIAYERRRLKRTHSIVKKSWLLGKIAHLENPPLIHVRNFIFKNLPQSIKNKQIRAIYQVDF